MTPRSPVQAAIVDGPCEADEDFFLMANPAPEDTGLPMVVRVFEHGETRSAPRVNVSLVHGRRMRADRPTSVSIRPNVAVVAGPALPHDDAERVRRWTEVNREVPLDHWKEATTTRELLERLVKI